MVETEGRLFFENGEWCLDAEPQVMILFERLFTGAKYKNYSYFVNEELQKNYVFTHRPRFLSDSLSARKDINWFITRFELDVSDEDRRTLKEGANEYDETQKQGIEAFRNYENVQLDFVLPLRDYQMQACSLALHKRFLLIADQVGLGKTPIGIAIASKNLPALCIVPPHLIHQWEEEIKKFIPTAKVSKIRTRKVYGLENADFYLVSYTTLKDWVETFTKIIPIKSIVFDEVHSLRHDDTYKYAAASAIAERCDVSIGLSATPIMNYGDELYNILDVLHKNALGDRDTFFREWCVEGKIRDPKLLGNFLRKNMMMVRRTREDVGMSMDRVNRVVYTVDADLEALKNLEDDMKILAMKAITGVFHESGESARELDWKLRQATGVAKARAVAEIVKTIADSGEKVVLFGWHRDVYDIWLEALREYHPVLFTGSESPIQKEAALKEFIEQDSKIFIMSLRSGAGVNGLQLVSSYAVFGELDWSPAVMNQCIGRLWRDGQEHQVNAIFVTVEDGSDPYMKSVIGEKGQQSTQIMNVEDKMETNVLSQTVSEDHLKGLARSFLNSKGFDVELIESERQKELEGQLFIDESTQDKITKGVYSLLKNNLAYFREEKDLQDHMETVLRKAGIKFMREFTISKHSRVDFNVEGVLIECKVKGFSKPAMLRQIRKYKYEYPQLRSLIIVTPEPFRHFKIDQVSVYTLNISNASLLMEGLT